ncbi:hypothetical protein BAU15_07405 [Enterococcus sp. JM4C]|uniref:sensor histidine kinase n=1 Tax=Candidatus Enterococcus huntleyi TaxID=1857217 RepID=UPI0013797110|nr:GHKL domain-containing protein [Enterococcus sp. JM4C]KAF1297533.1 hypothetical protein BAU15_07405 [Enterococcus sp. JM4C]
MLNFYDLTRLLFIVQIIPPVLLTQHLVKNKQVKSTPLVIFIALVLILLGQYLINLSELSVSVIEFLTDLFGDSGAFLIPKVLNSLCLFMSLFLITKRNKLPLPQMIFWTLLLANGFLLIDSFVTACLRLFLSAPHSVYLSLYVEAVLSLFFKIIFVQLCQIPFNRQRQRKLLVWESQVLIILGIVAFLSTSSILFVQLKQQTGVFSVRVQFFLIGLIFLFSTCFSFLYFTIENQLEKVTKLTAENQAFEGELQLIKSTQENNEKVRTLRHDLKNQYIVLAGLLERPTDENLKSAREYINHSLVDIQQTELFFTHNFVLNFLLNEKYALAKEQGIQLEIKVFSPETFALEESILTIIIGNLLDNAISAVDRNQEDTHRTIFFTMRIFNNNLKIEIENQFDPAEIKDRMDRQNRGLGIKNIQRAVDQVGGLYQQEIVDNLFRTTIILFSITK